MVEDKTLSFANGSELAAHVFEKEYSVDSVEVKDRTVILNLVEMAKTEARIEPSKDWIQEIIEIYGSEPNLFDGV